MKQLFLSPRSGETAYDNFKSTLAQGVEYERVSQFLNSEEKNILSKQPALYAWGCQPSIMNKWEQMVVGDYVLFYSHGVFVTASELLLKKQSESLALALWPKNRETGEAWSGVYFVENLRPINLPLAKFNDITGYKFKALMGFQRVTDDYMENILQRYGDLDSFIESFTTGMKSFQVSELSAIAKKESPDSKDLEKLDTIVGKRDIDEVLEELNLRNKNRSPEEKTIQSRTLKRDYKLVKALKEKYDYQCQICNFTFTTESGSKYCEAAHVEPLSSRKKGVDTAENIVILCPNHHKMLDFGAINVDEHGNLIMNESVVLKRNI